MTCRASASSQVISFEKKVREIKRTGDTHEIEPLIAEVDAYIDHLSLVLSKANSIEFAGTVLSIHLFFVAIDDNELIDQHSVGKVRLSIKLANSLIAYGVSLRRTVARTSSRLDSILGSLAEVLVQQEKEIG